MSKILTKITWVATFIAALAITTNANAWGPERPTYTNDNPAPYATFNSITDNEAIGDERNFVRVGEVGSTDPYTNEIEVVPGKEYEVYIYFHNDAADDTNATGYGVATQTRIASSYPTTVAKGSKEAVHGVLTWSYRDTNDVDHDGKIWDEAYFTTAVDNVALKFKTGTAIIHNNRAANGSVLSTGLFSEKGTLIGYNELLGVMPGCAQYSGYITYTLVAENVTASIEKQASLDGENWSSSVTAEPGQFITYKVVFKNNGNTTLSNVIFKDTHDDGLLLRPGHTTIYDKENVDGLVIDDILDLSGYNVGDVVPGELVQVIYQVKVVEKTTACKTLDNIITATFDTDTHISASALADIEGDACRDIPSELPNTGPLEITMAVIVALGIFGGGFYLWRTRHVLKTVENEVSGKNTQQQPMEEVKTTEQQTEQAANMEQGDTTSQKS